jgi:hypothetical protein
VIHFPGQRRRNRLAALEAAALDCLPPAERAAERLRRGDGLHTLTDEEIAAFIGDEAAFLRALPDALLDALVALPDDQAAAPLAALRAAFDQGPAAFAAALAATEQQYTTQEEPRP